MEESHRRPFRPKWYSWRPTCFEQLLKSEKDVLKCIEGSYVQEEIAGLNTIYWNPSKSGFSPNESQPMIPIVMLHGLGGGCALWVGIWKRLIEGGYQPYAIDLPGFARSRGVPLTGCSLDEILFYFISQIEKWLSASGIKLPYVLMGHSFGAYIATHVASRNVSNVRHLVLVDPWGVPDINRKQQKRLMKALPLVVQGFLSIISSFPPLHLLRMSGPWGPYILPRWRPTLADGYSDLISDPNVLFDYIFHMNSRPPVGEAAFHQLMEGPACAKRPLEKEFDQLFPDENHQPPIVFIYGQDTWMDISGSLRLQKRYKGRLSVIALPGAGHNVFQDQPKLFTQVLLKHLSEV